jgi:hypothetical protein
MSDTTTHAVGIQDKRCTEGHRESFCTEETHWGYIIRSRGDTGDGLIFTQSLSLLAGAALVAATIGLWLIPGMLFAADALMMRLFATIVFVSAASLLLWYSSRGTISEIQIDNSRGEIREVIRNHTGKMSLLACFSFDSIGGVFMEPAGYDDATNLVLRYRNSSETVEVASGYSADLAQLRDRISRDVMVGTSAMAKRNSTFDTCKQVA